jgi:type II secretory pathway component GspD/PulD (secretin)
MRVTLRRVVASAGVLAALALAPAARAQVPGRAYYDPPSSSYDRPARGSYVRVTVVVNGVQTTVGVPDGGSASLGGYSRVSESRSEYGPPVVGKVPIVSRGLRNTAYGRSTVSRRAIASVRIIDLREEEYRQTGYRSP